MILGFDTSCYTTSVAIVNEKDLIIEKRKLLIVEEGERGLQQSKALFQHLNNIPEIILEPFEIIKIEELKAIVVSSKPRPVKDSYMPVFTAGVSFAKMLSATLKLPLYFTSHQEGHIEAGVWSSNFPSISQFIAVHISGGTTEILKVSSLKKGIGYNIIKVGGTLDLHAGQLVDRVGVALGLDFPAGPTLEKLAQNSNGNLRIPTAVKGYNISFSGPETQAQRLIKEGNNPEDVARAVEHNIATSIARSVRNVIEVEGLKDILIVGGVAANLYLRKTLKKALEHKAVGARLHFAEPVYSTDNAVGVALLGLKLFKKHTY